MSSLPLLSFIDQFSRKQKNKLLKDC
uniref:Uncharacterized protein n=1 Tax=Arundo donax TaxID=35708 RepID=A0A0A8ZDE1_ARUDO